MIEGDKRAFAVLMAKLAKGLRGEIDRDQMAIMFEVLHEFSLNAVDYAVNEAIRRERFVPVPAVLAEYARQMPRPHLPARDAPKQLSETVPLEERKRLHEEGCRQLQAIFSRLDRQFGTSLAAKG